MTAPRPVHALVADLFFRARIETTASALGVPVAFARDRAELEAGLGDGPALVLVDLGHAAADPPGAIAALKARDPAPAVVAFGSHVDGPALAAAREAGADRVLARSAFTERLPDLLRDGP